MGTPDKSSRRGNLPLSEEEIRRRAERLAERVRLIVNPETESKIDSDLDSADDTPVSSAHESDALQAGSSSEETSAIDRLAARHEALLADIKDNLDSDRSTPSPQSVAEMAPVRKQEMQSAVGSVMSENAAYQGLLDELAKEEKEAAAAEIVQESKPEPSEKPSKATSEEKETSKPVERVRRRGVSQSESSETTDSVDQSEHLPKNSTVGRKQPSPPPEAVDAEVEPLTDSERAVEPVEPVSESESISPEADTDAAEPEDVVLISSLPDSADDSAASEQTSDVEAKTDTTPEADDSIEADASTEKVEAVQSEKLSLPPEEELSTEPESKTDLSKPMVGAAASVGAGLAAMFALKDSAQADTEKASKPTDADSEPDDSSDDSIDLADEVEASVEAPPKVNETLKEIASRPVFGSSSKFSAPLASPVKTDRDDSPEGLGDSPDEPAKATAFDTPSFFVPDSLREKLKSQFSDEESAALEEEQEQAEQSTSALGEILQSASEDSQLEESESESKAPEAEAEAEVDIESEKAEEGSGLLASLARGEDLRSSTELETIDEVPGRDDDENHDSVERSEGGSPLLDIVSGTVSNVEDADSVDPIEIFNEEDTDPAEIFGDDTASEKEASSQASFSPSRTEGARQRSAIPPKAEGAPSPFVASQSATASESSAFKAAPVGSPTEIWKGIEEQVESEDIEDSRIEVPSTNRASEEVEDLQDDDGSEEEQALPSPILPDGDQSSRSPFERARDRQDADVAMPESKPHLVQLSGKTNAGKSFASGSKSKPEPIESLRSTASPALKRLPQGLRQIDLNQPDSASDEDLFADQDQPRRRSRIPFILWILALFGALGFGVWKLMTDPTISNRLGFKIPWSDSVGVDESLDPAQEDASTIDEESALPVEPVRPRTTEQVVSDTESVLIPPQEVRPAAVPVVVEDLPPPLDVSEPVPVVPEEVEAARPEPVQLDPQEVEKVESEPMDSEPVESEVPKSPDSDSQAPSEPVVAAEVDEPVVDQPVSAVEPTSPDDKTVPRVAPNIDINNAQEVLDAFLSAESAEEMIRYVHDVDGVEGRIRSHYEGMKPADVRVNVTSIDQSYSGFVPGTDKEAYLYRIKTENNPDGFQVSLEQSLEGFRVDWDFFIQCEGRLLAQFSENPVPGETGEFMVVLRRAHAFGDTELEEGYDCFEIRPPSLEPKLTVYLKEGGLLADQLASKVVWGQNYFPVIRVEWVKRNADAEPHLEIRKILREKWRDI